jgi:hypothetical protein
MRIPLFKAIRKTKNIKHKKSIIAAVLILVVIFAGISIYQKSGSYYVVFDEIVPQVQRLNEYNIDVTFYEEEKIIEGKEKVTYVNKTKENIDSIYFHIYPNVFKTEKTAPFSEEEMDLAYMDGFEPGYINIKSVKSSEGDLSYLVLGKGNSILKVNLNEKLEAGDEKVLYIEFMVKIPPAYGRFGRGKNTINFGNWYPIAAVLDDSGWNLEPYYPVGDPFYSEVSNYRVAITMPPNYVVASTGDLIKKENIEADYEWTFEANKVRDFAMIASDKFKVLEENVDGINIRSYYFEDNSAELALNAAKDAIKIFNEAFGKYPYKHFSVAASDFFIGGMEYPKLVFIDQALYVNKEFLEYVIVHETAHQWWYGVVGNDEVEEAWLDESLTEYSTLLYYENKYGKEDKQKIYNKMIVEGYNKYKDNVKKDEESILRHLQEFNNNREYHALVYCKGAMFFEFLRQELGDEMFFDVLKVYYDKYKYKNATTEDFIKICEIVSDRDLKSMFNQWLTGVGE